MHDSHKGFHSCMLAAKLTKSLGQCGREVVAEPNILYKALAEPTVVYKITSSKIGELVHTHLL